MPTRLQHLMAVPVLATAFIAALAMQALAANLDQGLRATLSGDFSTALEHFQPLAREGDREAQYQLGLLHEYARGLPQDDTMAVHWYTRAASSGQIEAQYRLGVIHENGWGVEPDAKSATKWYMKAAEQGHAFAQHDLAFMLLKGKGVPTDRAAAYKWLRIAAASRADLMAKHLTHVSALLTASEILVGEVQAREWLRNRGRF